MPKFIGSAMSGRDGKDHYQPRLRRPRPHRSPGAGWLLFQPHRLHPDRDPQPARCPCRGRQEIDRAAYARARSPPFHRSDLEAVKAAGEKLHIKVVGLTSIAPDVSPALALETIESITVLGALHATKEIKSALADRIR